MTRLRGRHAEDGQRLFPFDTIGGLDVRLPETVLIHLHRDTKLAQEFRKAILRSMDSLLRGVSYSWHWAGFTLECKLRRTSGRSWLVCALV